MNIKNIKNSIKNITSNNSKELKNRLKEVVDMMSEDGKRLDNEYLKKYSELIQELIDKESNDVTQYNNIYNLTSHDINILDRNNNTKLVIEPAGKVARTIKEVKQVDNILYNGKRIKVNKNTFGEVENLPSPIENTAFIVSKRVINDVEDRDDLYFPEEIVYDEHGKIMGCRKLGQLN